MHLCIGDYRCIVNHELCYIIQGLVTSCFEVCAICGFIYGAACKLPPSLTIPLMNGCFFFPILSYLINQIYVCCNHQRRGYSKIGENVHRSKKLCLFASVGFLMQLGGLVSIPILLSNHFFVPSEETERYVIATYILIPVSLFIISIVWSGWIQKKIITSSVNNTDTTSVDAAENETTNKKVQTARYKSGN